MKIVHIVGRSNTGKTTFIKQVIPELERKGRVAVVKHLGDHRYNLQKGKDTTEFFDSGATMSIGIDYEKSVAAIRTTALDDILQFLFLEGIEYTIIEGFKNRQFPKIVIGDLHVKNTLLSNPTVKDVLLSLDRFEDYPPEIKSGKSQKKGGTTR
jgi:molybdopterin-guanine dinucleotide biosynthesis protein MobB